MSSESDAPGRHGGMVERGVTRPMARRHLTEHGGGMDRDEMLEQHHKAPLWVWWTVMLLGAWVLMRGVARLGPPRAGRRPADAPPGSALRDRTGLRRAAPLHGGRKQWIPPRAARLFGRGRAAVNRAPRQDRVGTVLNTPARS